MWMILLPSRRPSAICRASRSSRVGGRQNALATPTARSCKPFFGHEAALTPQRKDSRHLTPWIDNTVDTSPDARRRQNLGVHERRCHAAVGVASEKFARAVADCAFL